MPAPRKRPRPTSLAQGLLVARLLHATPATPGQLAARLGISRRTIERILRTLEAGGERVTVRRDGREAWYSIGGPS